MKYLIAFLVGLFSGVTAFALLMYYNPFSSPQTLSPLAVSDHPTESLLYSAVPNDAVFYTNNGETFAQPKPEAAAELWEPPVRDTHVLVVELRDSRGEPAGLGIKFATHSEKTRVLNSEVLVDSAWHIYRPGEGTLFVDQTENYWAYVRDIVIGARMNSTDNWRGTWNRVMTIGPKAIGTARVIGGNGRYRAAEGEAVEFLNATAFSAATGPVAAEGTLTIALPETGDGQSANAN